MSLSDSSNMEARHVRPWHLSLLDHRSLSVALQVGLHVPVVHALTAIFLSGGS